MTVRWQTIALPFNSGVDTKTDAKSLAAPKLLALENATFEERVGFRKRYGTRLLPRDVEGSATALSAATALFARSDELVMLSASHIYSYADAFARWIDKGDYVPLSITPKTVAYTQGEQTNADRATAGGVTVYAWDDSRGTARFSVVDNATGASLINDQDLGTTTCAPRCIAIDGNLHVLYVRTSAGTLFDLVIRPDDVVASAAESAHILVDDVNTSTIVYDVCVYTDSFAPAVAEGEDRALLCYATSTDTNRCIRIRPNGSVCYEGYLGSGSGPDMPTTVVAISVFVVRNFLASVFVGVGNDLKVEHLTIGSAGLYYQGIWTTEAGSAAITHIAACHDTAIDDLDDDAVVWWERTANDNIVYHGRYRGGTTIRSGTTGSIRHSHLASRTFTYGMSSYVNLVHASTLQTTYFVQRADGVILGREFPGMAGGAPTRAVLPQVEETDTGEFAWAGIFRRRLDADPTDGNAVYSAKGVKDIAIDFNATPASVQEGESLYLTGGFLWQYDGQAAVEAGFLVYPEGVTATKKAGGSMTAGSYSYRAYYEWLNAKGERERSTCSAAVSVDLSAGDLSVSVVVPTLTHTLKSNVAIVIYRSEVNPSDAAPFYRVTNTDPTDTSGANCYVLNDTTANTVTFVDEMLDATLVMKELDYQNAEREHLAPESSTVIASGKNRVWLAGFEDENKVAYSKTRWAGESVAFNDTYEVIVPRDGGVVTALAVMNDALVVFKRSRVYLVTGDGPNNVEAAGGYFNDPQLVTSDAGCIDQRSVVSVPAGLMFQSAKGIYLLDQSYRLAYIGADVEDYNAQVITAATLLPSVNQARFLTSSGSLLLYDYMFNQWATFTGCEGVGAVLWQDDYTFAESDGEVRVEDETTYRDGTAQIVLSWTTAWVKLNTLQCYQRVRRGALLGEWKSSHKLRVEIAYDYEDIWSDVIEFDPSTVLNLEHWGDDAYWGAGAVWGGDDSTVYQFRFRIPRQKCEAIRFRFTDIPGSPAGESFQASELALEVGLMGGLHRMPSGKTL